MLNVDFRRDRCQIPELNQGKLRRVSFCVDVEIAGFASRESEDDDEDPAEQQSPQPSEQLASPVVDVDKKHYIGSKSKRETETSDNTNGGDPAAAATKEKNTDNAVQDSGASLGTSPGETNVDGEIKELSRKQGKKKRSEEERKERKERRRRHAEAYGAVPLELDGNDDDEGQALTEPSPSQPRPQSTSVTDPVRIYRRCCKLRESPVLKRVVDQISLPSSTLAESPGTVGVLDLHNFPMNHQDITTFSDWLAIVPVRKLILENCHLTDYSIRAILSGLLATKTVEQMNSRRKRTGSRQSSTTALKEEKYGVVEKVSFKNNPKIGPEGWRHISLFIHMSRSLKAVDLTGVPFPKARLVANGVHEDLSAAAVRINKSSTDVTTIFANSLAERFGGDHLEELLLSESSPSTEDVKKVCDGATALGLKRLGLANCRLTREGFAHVVRYFEDGKCEGLDVGGNDLCDHLDLFLPALEKNRNLYALSLADCSLTPPVMHPLLQGLVRQPKLYFVDFSHNPELFSSVPNALAVFSRYLPKMPWLKRIHLADVNLTPDQAIGLAEVLSECPKLCHLNILENREIVNLTSAKDPGSQEEACALYASLMAAVRVSRTIVALDIEVPSEGSNEVVKALASQIVAYSLRNLENGAIEELPQPPGPPSSQHVPIPEVLQHLVGQVEEDAQAECERYPDEDYVIGGTGVVKALGVCLGTINNTRGESVPASGTSTPVHRKSKPLLARRPLDMSKNLLESARNIRTRIQYALVQEDRAGNDRNYSMFSFSCLISILGLSGIVHTDNFLSRTITIPRYYFAPDHSSI